jgi:hypothetical protein
MERLEQRAIAGLFGIDGSDAEAAERRYWLPAAPQPVFVEEEKSSVTT